MGKKKLCPIQTGANKRAPCKSAPTADHVHDDNKDQDATAALVKSFL